jgi:hypothetical protein
MQAESNFMASSSLPLCRQSSTFLTLIPENGAAVQVALQLPQAIHLLASGSIEHNCSNLLLSILSRSMVELADNLNPNPFMPFLR